MWKGRIYRYIEKSVPIIVTTSSGFKVVKCLVDTLAELLKCTLTVIAEEDSATPEVCAFETL